MSVLRNTTSFTALTRRTGLFARPFSTTPSRFATQGYGDGKGDPKGEDPQAQGASSHETHRREHPGPDAPSVGQGTGAGPTKAGTSKTPEDASAQSGGARSKEAKETGSSPTGGSVGGGKNGPDGAQPKIHDRSTPSADGGKEAEVKQHNKEFEQHHNQGSSSG